MTLREEVEAAVRAALSRDLPALRTVKFEVYKPREKSHGDFATNVAIVSARQAGSELAGNDPAVLAERIASTLRTSTALFSSVEVARPGFINLTLSKSAYLGKLEEILSSPDDAAYGSSSAGEGKLVQVEFVSANPTGPLNVVSARAAAVGDALVRLLRRTGHAARSEFYVNDAGSQVGQLGKSVEARFREILGEKAAIPEGGYPGEYLIQTALQIKQLADWADRRAVLEAGAPWVEDDEGRAVASMLGDVAACPRKDASEARAFLEEYLSWRSALDSSLQSAWAAHFAIELSRRSLTMNGIARRLGWIDRYRDYYQKISRPAGGKAQAQEPMSAARVFLGEAGAAGFDFGRFAVEQIVEGQKRSLENFGTGRAGGLKFDAWVRESTLRGVVEEVSRKLASDGRFIAEKDGAIWLKAPEAAGGPVAGSDKKEKREKGESEKEDEEKEEKDEWVIRRRTGEPTYFLSDIAYHVDKRRRGFERVIDIWGPDHHGHVWRMKQAMLAVSQVMPELAIGPDWLEIMIAQQVNLVREGKRTQMSKRAGEYVTLDDVVCEVGADASRFFFLMRRSNSHLDFDLDLAKKTSEENPVYYVQYAHARIASILQNAREGGLKEMRSGASLALLSANEEIDLIKGLSDFDEVVLASAQALEPHRIINYLVDLAARFHRFYHNHRVISDDRALSEARLALCIATRIVLVSALSLVGVSAPESM